MLARLKIRSLKVNLENYLSRKPASHFADIEISAFKLKSALGVQRGKSIIQSSYRVLSDPCVASTVARYLIFSRAVLRSSSGAFTTTVYHRISLLSSPFPSSSVLFFVIWDSSSRCLRHLEQLRLSCAELVNLLEPAALSTRYNPL